MEENPKPAQVETLKSRASTAGDIVFYDLSATVGKQRYWVDAARRESDGYVSVFSVMREGGARQISGRSQMFRDIESAVRDHLGMRTHNPKALKAKLLRT